MIMMTYYGFPRTLVASPAPSYFLLQAGRSRFVSKQHKEHFLAFILGPLRMKMLSLETPCLQLSLNSEIGSEGKRVHRAGYKEHTA